MLPFLNSARGSTKKQIVSFRGINFSDRYTDGDLRDCKNLSARRFPYMTTRRARKKIEEHTGASAFLYRDKPIVVKGTDLIYDGNVVAQVKEGEKQFAMVNTKLCVFPDKISYDVKTGVVESFSDKTYSAYGAEFEVVTGATVGGEIISSISVDEVGSIGDGQEKLTNSAWVLYKGENETGNSTIYSYGEDYKAVEACWDAADSKWDMEKLGALEKENKSSKVGTGEIVILSGDGYILEKGETNVQSKDYGNEGLYAIVSDVSQDGEGTMHISRGNNVYGHIFKAYGGKHSFAEVFEKGDAISIEGTRGGIYDVEKALLGSVDVNKLTFPGDVFRVIHNGNNIIDEITYATTVKDGTTTPGRYHLYWNDNYKYEFNLTTKVEGKHSFFVTKSYIGDVDEIYILNVDTRTVVEVCSARNNSSTSSLRKGDLSDVKKTDSPSSAISFSKPYPDLDFVCESENRLWGCSNKDQTIYASALGDPSNLFINEGLSTDSFAVAVGTEGEFTGCCKHSSSVLFFKETKLHKILGSFPAEYIMYTYDTEGLQKGSHKSMQIINDTLFFLGNHGVYSYSGGVPQLISSNFGETQLTNGVAGNDGDTYYLSALEGETRHLLLYETKSGLWLKEDATNAVDFARDGRDLYMLDANGDVWLMDAKEEDAEIEWMAHFTPFYESIEGRKMFTKLILRLELPKGSWMKAEVRCDGGLWRESGKVIGRDSDSVPLYLPVNRCDELEVRLSGFGPCTIKTMALEYYIGSDV